MERKMLIVKLKERFSYIIIRQRTRVTDIVQHVRNGDGLDTSPQSKILMDY